MMQWFLDLSTRAKLLLGFGFMIILVAIVAMTAYRSITAMQESQKTLYEREFANAVDLKDVRANQNAVRADILSMFLLTRRSDQEALDQDFKSRAKHVAKVMKTLVERNKSNPKILSMLEEFEATRAIFREAWGGQVIPKIFEGKVEEAKTIVFGAQADRDVKMNEIANKLGHEAEQAAQRAVTQSSEQADGAIRIFAILGFIALLLSTGMVFLLNRVIANPLKEISGIAEQVASGNLTVNVPSLNRGDEVGALVETFRGMVANLREVNQQTREGVNVLASSASEILATTTQVASSAAETATAISETTTTVEEVKQTGHLSSQKAKYVVESSQKAAEVARAGRKTVETSVAGMKHIQTQMDSIAESIVRLSEQSQTIGEIIASVNDLADQSNLLAVNAAIEAAKAGEQGKGFGVVAQEIRSLAEQSKQATAQVRNILSEIQKATSAAVMATEQGSKAVESGVKQSAEVDESIRVLADTMAEAAQAATQIAASSQQQLVGTDQVALAMESIRQASTQNVAGTKQAETAAHNLHELGQKLKQLVEQYRV